MITPERWARLRPLVAAALQATPASATATLAGACGEDGDARNDALRVLEACRRASDSLPWLDSPAVELMAPLLEAAGPFDRPRLEAGTRLGRYTIERVLGAGGMGVVYLARDHRLGRPVALKLLPSWLTRSETARRQFLEEARAASALDHPNIGTVYEIGELADGQLALVLAFYGGGTLEERLAQGPLELLPALDVACQIADGLAAAHARGIVHRDIKPSNIVVTSGGLVKVVDFGAAIVADRQLAGIGPAVGTIAYMSPEQTRAGDLDPRSDVWSVGVLLYEVLTGQRPFTGHDRETLVRSIRSAQPPPLLEIGPGLPAELASIIGRCLCMDRGQRYPDAGALARDLRRERRRAAVSGTTDARQRRPARLRRAWRLRWATAAIAGLAAAAYLMAAGSRGPDDTPAGSLAVLPLLPAAEDTALRRLGRELVITLSTSLDGVAGIRATDPVTVLSQVPELERPGLAEAARLGRRLGAGVVVHGSLVRVREDVRLDLVVVDATNRSVTARITAAAPATDLVAITDSAALALLRRMWPRGGPPVPDLAAATTRSVPALRAYLAAELAFARADYDEAVRQFDRAFAADTSFWLAYWRSRYPRSYRGTGEDHDPAVLETIFPHRARLPASERLLVEAHRSAATGDRLVKLREVTERFPGHWPAWWDHANALVHEGAYLGFSYDDSRAALERLLALNPRFATGWEHLFWVVGDQRDAAAADSALAALERLRSADTSRLEPDPMPFYHVVQRLVSSGDELDHATAAALAHVVLRHGPRLPAEMVATGFLRAGFPRAQIRLTDAILGEEPPSDVAAAHFMGRALAWASRGAWDSALVAIRQGIRLSDDPDAALHAYGLAAIGVWLGTMPPTEAAELRPAALRALDRNTVDDPADHRAVIAWLDGLIAFSRSDPGALADAAAAIRGGGSRHAGVLARSLAAFALHEAGRTAEAARALAALEWERAERQGHVAYGPLNPYLSTVHRLAAGGWLLAAGDTAQAARLLTWHEAILGGEAMPVETVNRTFEPLAQFERARIAEGVGRADEARHRYQLFLDRYDMPPPGHRGWVGHARRTIDALSAAGSER